jgi:hypothetical protein
MRLLLVVSFIAFVLPASSAAAQEAAAPSDGPIHLAIANAFIDVPIVADSQTPAPRVAAFEYSDAYKTRAKIHKYASVATMPLFATELWLGQSLYTSTTQSKKGAHVAIGSGIVGLYGLQAVTGVWNLVEARKDEHGRTRRMVHGILMLASGAGFAITPMVAPGGRDRFEPGGGSRSTHRAVAFTSIGIGTAGYLVMLLGGK